MVKRKMFMMVIVLAAGLGSAGAVRAQDPISGIIAQGITRVIRAFDLQVQRIQTATIWLQDVQQELGNAMQALHLDEIRDWVQQLKDLYGEYFGELWRVKTVIANYHRVKSIMEREAQLVSAYRHARSLLQQDKHFSVAEVEHMYAVYTGILDESAKALDMLSTVLGDFITQMSDGSRLSVINEVGDRVDRQYGDLVRFNNQNAVLSLQRAKDEEERDMVKKMYGLK